jgi:hypothetical protein
MEDLRRERRLEGKPIDGLVVHCPWCGNRMMVNSGLAPCSKHGMFQITYAPGPHGEHRIKVKTV